MIATQSNTDFSQSKCYSVWLNYKKSLRHMVSVTTHFRSPGYVLPSCFCGINKLFVNRMAKHFLTRFQVHKVWGNWMKGERWKVISHVGLFFCWAFGCLSDWGLGNSSDTGLLPKDYWELAQTGFYYEVLSLSFSYSFCLVSCCLKFIKMQGII